MNQSGLFDTIDEARLAKRREQITLASWAAWGWRGPSAGGKCEIDIPVADTEDGGCLYCYCEQARLIELRKDGKWLAEIEMPGEWTKNGRRVVLDRHWIAPPRREIRTKRMTDLPGGLTGDGTT